LLLIRCPPQSFVFRHKPTQWIEISSAHGAIEKNGFDQRPEDSVPRAAVRSAHHGQGSASVPGTETSETRTVPVQREGLHVAKEFVRQDDVAFRREQQADRSRGTRRSR